MINNFLQEFMIHHIGGTLILITLFLIFAKNIIYHIKHDKYENEKPPNKANRIFRDVAGLLIFAGFISIDLKEPTLKNIYLLHFYFIFPTSILFIVIFSYFFPKKEGKK